MDASAEGYAAAWDYGVWAVMFLIVAAFNGIVAIVNYRRDADYWPWIYVGALMFGISGYHISLAGKAYINPVGWATEAQRRKDCRNL